MLNTIYFHNLRAKVVAAAEKVLQPTELVIINSNHIFFAYCAVAKIKICKKCAGKGCLKCKGAGHTGGSLPTEAEAEKLVASKLKVFKAKLVRLHEKETAKIQAANEKAAKKAQEVKANQEAVLAKLTPVQQIDLKVALKEVDTDFGRSIKTWWDFSGKLSDHQVEALLRSYQAKVTQEVEAEFYQTYIVGTKATVRVKPISIKEEFVQDRLSNRNVLVTKLSMKSSTNQIFSVSTTSEKRVQEMNALLEAGKHINVTATVKWIAPSNKYISLSGKGLKIHAS